MKFFKNRGVAITITVLLIIVALVIGFSRAPAAEYQPQSTVSASSWAKEHGAEYEKFIYDGAELLSASTEAQLAQSAAALDYQYASLMGILVVDGLDGQQISDAAYDYGYELGCGESDLVLLIDTDTQDWYLAYGDEMADYVDHELEILFRSYLGEEVYAGDADRQLTGLYSGLADWYEENIPLSGAYLEQDVTGADVAAAIFAILIVVLVIVAVVAFVRALARPRYYGASGDSGGGFWRGMFWGSMLGGRHRHGPPPPPPPHNPPPRNPPHNPPPSGGGFGGSSRNSFGSRPGGFGGSSRGSSFGGRSGGSRGGFGGGSRGGFGGKR